MSYLLYPKRRSIIVPISNQKLLATDAESSLIDDEFKTFIP
jgi:hypothetical protein